MSDESVPFHECFACHGLLGLWEEVIATHPVTGKEHTLHDRCAAKPPGAIGVEWQNVTPIKDWLATQ